MAGTRNGIMRIFRLAKYSTLRTFTYLVGSCVKFVMTGKALSFPNKVQIQTNSTCNGKCVFCPYTQVSRRLPQGKMETSLFQKIIDELSSSPDFVEVLFELHNEPLLDNRTFQFIKYVKTKNRNNACTLVTNGQTLDMFSLSEILQSDIDKFIISLNAHSPETYERVVGLDYNHIKNNIDSVLSEADLRQKLILSFVVTEQTANEIHQAREYWHKKGIRTRAINVSNRAGVLRNFALLKPRKHTAVYSSSERIKAFIAGIISRITGCFKPFSDMTILFNGDVILCCHDWDRTTIIGNINKSSLKEIWNSQNINEIRKLTIRKKYSQINLCKNCSERG
jgi:radical SAM protein with 4Fe4S-binding SPASM domain